MSERTGDASSLESDDADGARDRISVCICTFKRPVLLGGLLEKLRDQNTEGQFTYDIVVIDNDGTQSAREVVLARKSDRTVEIFYDVEPQQNIARVRNKAIAAAKGNLLAFIDDDEVPRSDWLLQLYRTLVAYQGDAVLGPVLPLFTQQPPAWIVRSGLCERPTYSTGTSIPWHKTRTGNVLLRRAALLGNNEPFDVSFGSQGEDVNFFRCLAAEGRSFIWSNEAAVSEVVPPERCRVGYHLRRAVLQGRASFYYHGNSLGSGGKARLVLKSSAAAVLYSLALPLLALGGVPCLMKYLVKDLHHISRLAAACGANLPGARRL